MDEKIKTWTLRFPAKENPNMGRHSLIGQSCCIMMSKQSIDWFLESPSGMKFFLAERIGVRAGGARGAAAPKILGN